MNAEAFWSVCVCARVPSFIVSVCVCVCVRGSFNSPGLLAQGPWTEQANSPNLSSFSVHGIPLQQPSVTLTQTHPVQPTLQFPGGLSSVMAGLGPTNTTNRLTSKCSQSIQRLQGQSILLHIFINLTLQLNYINTINQTQSIYVWKCGICMTVFTCWCLHESNHLE